MKAEICALADIPATGSLEVEFFGRPLHVVMTGQGRPVAFANACLHFGGPLVCGEDGVFECQWHQARFDHDSGVRLDGPAPRDSRLMRFSTIVEDGKLVYVWNE
ncbi:MAG: Rieske (2Fe-2S) protein [Thermoleophilia bacterium]